ncbi:MAG: IclR family transcriptional regulator [Pseudomonadota bacterium]
MDIEETGVETDRNFVTSIARGFDVLRCFRADERALTNQQIAARTGLPKPTVSRLTYTLCKLGYLVQSDSDGTYRLGAGVLSLGYSVLAQMELAERAKEEMAKLCEGPNHFVTAALAERHRLHVVYVTVLQTDQAVSLTMEVGARLPLFFSAIGRAVLMGMSEEERAHLIHLAVEDKPEQEAAIRDSVASAEASYCAHGYVTSFGDWRKEVNGLAVPVRAPASERLYGLNVGGPSFLVSAEQLISDYGARLVTAGQRLSSI